MALSQATNFATWSQRWTRVRSRVIACSCGKTKQSPSWRRRFTKSRRRNDRMRRRGIGFTLGACAASALMVNVASADLGADVERVKLAWASSAKLTEQRPRLLERGAIRRLFLERENLDPTNEDCTTIA